MDVQRIREILEKRVCDNLGLRCYSVAKNSVKLVKDLSFLCKGLTLSDTDPSYKLRYGHALRFWRENLMGDEKISSSGRLNGMEKDLKKELCQKKYLFIKDDDAESFDCPDESLSEKDESHVVGYVTTITESYFFIKPAENSLCEVKVKKEEMAFSMVLNPGDEVEVTVYGKKKTYGNFSSILKYL